MKKLLIFAGFGCFPLLVFAQANVGIGTATPTTGRLVIESPDGTSALVASTVPTGLGFSMGVATTAPLFGFNLRIQSGGVRRMGEGFGGMFQFQPSDGRLLYFPTSATGAAGTVPIFSQPNFSLNPTGNTSFYNYVGFNIEPHPESGRVVIAHNSTLNSPTLQLVETNKVDFARLEFTNQANNRFWHIAGNQSEAEAASDQLKFFHSTAGDIMQISGNGSVGIGGLPASGDGKMYINYNSSTINPHLKLRENQAGDYARLELTSLNASRVWQIAGMTVAGLGSINRQNDLLNFWNSSYGDIMSIRGDGRVGINTTSHATGYALSVRGKIICEELRVQLASAGWPDYVFGDNYRLKPLSEVETHIQQYKHLPGIPAAATIELEGLDIGEMQRRMMEKIEELTLYIIEQQKELKRQQQEIESLKVSVNRTHK